MRKIGILVILFALALSLSACNSEKVILHCDGENCENTVEMKANKDAKPDESWIVYCKDCADNVLHD